jgi:hypothetical protein
MISSNNITQRPRTHFPINWHPKDWFYGGNDISHKIRIRSEFPKFPTIIVDNEDFLIRKLKDLNVEYFDDSFLLKIFHFFAANSWERTGCPLTFIFLLVTAFFECSLSVVSGNYLNLKVTKVSVFPGLDLTKEFLSEKRFCPFSRKQNWRNLDGILLEGTIFCTKPFQWRTKQLI